MYDDIFTYYSRTEPPEGFETYELPFTDLFTEENEDSKQEEEDNSFFDSVGISLNSDNLKSRLPFELFYPTMETDSTLSVVLLESSSKPVLNNRGNYGDLTSIDIEDLFKQEGLTSINGKTIRFGNKQKRAKNASYGVDKSHHKEIDPKTGNANARDISIVDGSDADYTEFRRLILNNPRIMEWLRLKNWGILNELTAGIMKRNKATGRHFHFGPDTSARRTLSTWINNPDISVTKVV